MSRYKVTYKPGGAIAQDIGLTIKMQPKAEAALPAVAPAVVGPLTFIDVVQSDQTESPFLTETVPADFGGLYTAAILYGTTNPENITWNYTWTPDTEGNGEPDMSIHGDAYLIHGLASGGSASPGTLALTATYEGTTYGPITLTITALPAEEWIAVWVDSLGNPLIDGSSLLVSDLSIFTERIEGWCESIGSCVITAISGSFLHMARLVNADVVSAGLAAPLFIDESLCGWQTNWDGAGDQPYICVSGASIAVAYNEYMSSGVLTITPEFNGTSLPVLTLTVTSNNYNGCV